VAINGRAAVTPPVRRHRVDTPCVDAKRPKGKRNAGRLPSKLIGAALSPRETWGCSRLPSSLPVGDDSHRHFRDSDYGSEDRPRVRLPASHQAHALTQTHALARENRRRAGSCPAAANEAFRSGTIAEAAGSLKPERAVAEPREMTCEPSCERHCFLLPPYLLPVRTCAISNSRSRFRREAIAIALPELRWGRGRTSAF
jgi:hypothetical protein